MEAVSTKESITRFHWKIEFVGGLHLLLISLDIGVLSFALPQLVPAWGLGPTQIATIIIASGVGTLIGGIFVGNAADRIGRRYALQLSLILTAIGTALGAISWDYVSLAAFQFLAGLGIGAVAPVTGTFVGEFAPAKYRGRLSVLLELFWIGGSLAATLASIILVPGFGWRGVFIFGAIPLIWVAMQRRFMPESPRYLMSQGRHNEVRLFVEQIRQKYGLSYDHLMQQQPHANKGLLASLGELLSGPLLKRAACTWLLWFVLLYTYYGIFIWWPTLMTASGVGIMRTLEYMLVFTSVQIPGIVVASFLVDVIGRKAVIVPALFICGVAAYMFGNATSPVEILIWGSVVSTTNLAAFGVMVGYTAELFPTRVRGTGAGSASAFGRMGTVIVPAAVALLVSSWSAGFQAVFVMFAIVLLIGALGVGILGEETKGRTLEEIGT
ncbi:MAG: MFS transporter [Chloroflexi bacterium]|nr:MFS transporter [Chloroflexota bacterium]